MAVTANEFADALCVTTFSSNKTEAIVDLVGQETRGASTPKNILRNAFKHARSAKNLNQLLMDFATGQCKLLALGIRQIIWDATYSLGVAKFFSSHWKTDD
jgi:hypothetical protein